MIIAFPNCNQTLTDAYAQARLYGATLKQKGGNLVWEFDPSIKHSLREQAIRALGVEVEFDGGGFAA